MSKHNPICQLHPNIVLGYTCEIHFISIESDDGFTVGQMFITMSEQNETISTNWMMYFKHTYHRDQIGHI